MQKQLLFIIAFCIPLFVLSKPDIVFDENTDCINIESQLWIYEDYYHSFDAEEIIKQNLFKSFTQNKSSNTNLGFSQSAYWTYITVYNPYDDQKQLYLEVAPPHLNKFELYILNNNKISERFNHSQYHRDSSNTLPHRYILCPIKIKPKATVKLLMYFSNKGENIFFQPKLWEANNFIAHDTKRNLSTGLIFGVIGILLIVSLYLAIVSKQIPCINYLFYSVPTFIVLLNIEYVTFALPDSFGLFSADLSVIIFSLLSCIFLLHFYENTRLNIEKIPSKPLLSRVLKLFGTILLLLSFFGDNLKLFSSIGMALFIPITLLYILIKSSIKTYKSATSFNIIFLGTFLASSAGFIIFILRRLSVVSNNFLTEHALLYGLAIQEVVFFLIVLEIYRKNQLQTSAKLEKNSQLVEQQKLDLQIALSNLEKLSLIAKETENCIVIFNNRAQVIWINDSFTRIYNKTLFDIQDNNSLFSNIYSAKNKVYYENCLAQKQSIKFEAQLLTENNEIRWSQITLTPSLGADGEVYEIIAIEADITDIKQMQIMLHKAKEKAEEASRLKTAFLSNMSHELRTPLNGIIGFSDLILDKHSLDPKLNKFLMLIKENGLHLLDLICNLLDVSKIEAGSMSVDNKSFTPIDIINDIYKKAENTVKQEKPQLALFKECDTPDLEIFSDRNKIKQVLLNFLSNAIKFTHNGHIKIGFKSTDKHYSFYIEDTGIGIDEAAAEVIFMRFRQSDDSATREYGGVGIGLTICAGIAKLLNCKVDFTSNKGAGTTFYFNIPKTDINQKSQPQSQSRMFDYSILENAKILTVMETESDFNLIESKVSQYKALSFFAKNGKDAVFRLQKGMNPDIVIIELQPSDTNSIEVVEQIRHVRTQIGIIGIASISTESEVTLAINAGCNAVLGKPPETENLVITIAELLQKKKKGKN